MTSIERADDGAPTIGAPAPDFTAPSTHGTMRFREWQAGTWTVLLSHPGEPGLADVELDAFVDRKGEFAERGVKLLVVTLAGGVQRLEDGPTVAHLDVASSRAFGLFANERLARAVFVLDPSGDVRAALTYPEHVTRTADGALRLVDALRTAGASWTGPGTWSLGRGAPTRLEPDDDPDQEAAGAEDPLPPGFGPLIA